MVEDRMRLETRKLTDEELAAVKAVKSALNEASRTLDRYVHPGRELSLAQTKLEEACMWAIKGIT